MSESKSKAHTAPGRSRKRRGAVAGGDEGPKQKVASRAPAAGEIAPTRWLTHLQQQLPIAYRGEDAEGVHQIRVAIARLQVWLRLGGFRVLHDDLKWLRDRAARVRDLDVHLAQNPPRALRLRLRRELAEARAELRRALEDRRVDGLITALLLLPNVSRAQARRRLSRLAHAALLCGEDAFGPRFDAVALHTLRRRIRRVRFALEWSGMRATRMAALQDALGAVGDRMVALRQFDTTSQKEHGLSAYRTRLENELAHNEAQARRLWQVTQPKLEEIARWKSS